jgi:hypothetical protein
VLLVIPVLFSSIELDVVFSLTAVISVRNPFDAACVICSSPVDTGDPDAISVDLEFCCVLVVVPVFVLLVEVDDGFSLTAVTSVAGS